MIQRIIVSLLILSLCPCTINIVNARKGKEKRNLRILISKEIEGVNLSGAYKPQLFISKKPEKLLFKSFRESIGSVFLLTTDDDYDVKLVINVSKFDTSEPKHQKIIKLAGKECLIIMFLSQAQFL